MESHVSRSVGNPGRYLGSYSHWFLKGFGGCILMFLSSLLVPSPLHAQTTTVVYEAEAGANTLSGTAAITNCSACSNAYEVAGIGGSSSNYLIVNNVQANGAGQAIMDVFYLENGTATLSVSVNGGTATNYSLTGTSTTSPTFADILVNLNNGSNTIKLFDNTGVAPSIDRIVVTTGGSNWGLMTNGDRDKYSWPFYYGAILNYPIGSGAVYQPAGITSNDGGGYTTTFYIDEEVEVMTPTAPETGIYYSDVGWDGGNRCAATGGLEATVPIPNFYVLPNSGENNSATILESDSTTIEQNEPLTRCTVGASATTYAWGWPTESIYGSVATGSHGGSGLSAIGGTIRLGEFLSGKIHHPMKIAIWAKQYYYCCTYHWPATNVDGYANSTYYGGTNPNLGPGALMALKPSFNVSSLSTTPGKILAQALIDYGAYLDDDTYSNSWALDTEQGPNGRVQDEFYSLYGYSMVHPASGSAFMNDMITIFQNLNIVTNNSSGNYGGGGTPLVPLAPVNIGN